MKSTISAIAFTLKVFVYLILGVVGVFFLVAAVKDLSVYVPAKVVEAREYVKEAITPTSVTDNCHCHQDCHCQCDAP